VIKKESIVDDQSMERRRRQVSKKLPMIKSFAQSLRAEIERMNEINGPNLFKAAGAVIVCGEVPLALTVAFGLEEFDAASCRSCSTRFEMDASLDQKTQG
jgi:hypothetical protein